MESPQRKFILDHDFDDIEEREVRLAEAEEILKRLEAISPPHRVQKSLSQGRTYKEYAQNLQFNSILIWAWMFMILIAVILSL